MRQTIFRTNVGRHLRMLIVLGASWQAYGQATPYPTMAPVDQYMMERNAEIALAQSAAPDSLSHDADVFVMGAHGYESAVQGKNGFVCAVLRSWTAGSEDPDFWNPKLRAPICFNAAAARSYWPIMVKKTELILAGQSKEGMFASMQSSFDKKELPTLEVGAMCYMMSREQYLGDTAAHWHPHLMFIVPQTSDAAWGAGLTGSPVVVGQDPADHLTVFMVPLDKWSDGTAEHADDKAANNSPKKEGRMKRFWGSF